MTVRLATARTRTDAEIIIQATADARRAVEILIEHNATDALITIGRMFIADELFAPSQPPTTPERTARRRG